MILFKVSLSLGIELASSMTRPWRKLLVASGQYWCNRVANQDAVT